MDGARGEGRTLNLRLRRPTLYPIELLAQREPRHGRATGAQCRAMISVGSVDGWLGSISRFEWPEWSPSKSNAGGRHAKAEASFAHSKRCREVRLLLQTLRLRPGPRCHDARSVWSARSLLPLYEETSKTVRQATRSPRFKSTKKSMLPLCHF